MELILEELLLRSIIRLLLSATFQALMSRQGQREGRLRFFETIRLGGIPSHFLYRQHRLMCLLFYLLRGK